MPPPITSAAAFILTKEVALALDEITEYTNLLEDILTSARPTFAELKRLAERTGIIYHYPTTSFDEIHELAREATRSAELLSRVLDQLPVVLPHVGAREIERLRDARPNSLRESQHGVSQNRPNMIERDSQLRPETAPLSFVDSTNQNSPDQQVSRSDRPHGVNAKPEDKDISHAIRPDSSRQSAEVTRDDETQSGRRSDAMRATYIGGLFVLIAAVIGAILTVIFTNLFGPDPSHARPPSPSPARISHNSSVQPASRESSPR